MIYNVIRTAAISCALILMQLSTYAIKNTATNKITDPSNGNSFVVSDVKYLDILNTPNWEQAYENVSSTAILEYGFNMDDDTPIPVGSSATISLSVKYYTHTGGNNFSTQIVNYKNLKVVYQPDGVSKELILKTRQNVYWMEVTVSSNPTASPTAASAAIKSKLYVQGSIVVERHYNMPRAFSGTNTIASLNLSRNYNSSTNSLDLSWDNSTLNAEEFDLEWVFVDNYDDNKTLTPLAASQIPFGLDLFERNSTRISLSAKENQTAFSHSIPMLYEQGYLLFRLRGKGYVSNSTVAPFVYFDLPLEGEWTTDGLSTINTVADFTAAVSNQFWYLVGSGHANDLNWLSNVTFTEGGKNKYQLTYADGINKPRQSVSKINSQGEAIVSEVIYDNQGREALQFLPTPTGNPQLQFYQDFNLGGTASSPEAYNSDLFDKVIGNNCEPITGEALSETTGASAARYYSPFNPAKTTTDQFVPNAEGYPFTQTKYLSDHSGRIESQTVPGAEMKAGSTHETRYLYGMPLQRELDELFAADAGLAFKYKKNGVIDPNNQVSFSYIDPNGNTVATSLADGNATLIDLNPPNASKSSDLLDKILPSYHKGELEIIDELAGTRTFSKSIIVAKPESREFTYDYTHDTYTIVCLPDATKNVCYDCVVDVEISLKDDCGIEYLAGIDGGIENKVTIPLNSTVNNSCNGANKNLNLTWETNDGTASDGSAIMDLNIGTYQLSKKVTINEEKLTAFTDDYIENNACLLTYTDFETEEAGLISNAGCNVTCAACTTSLGSSYNNSPYRKFLMSGSTTLNPNCEVCLEEEEYNTLLAQCLDACRPKSVECESKLSLLIDDISPGGQYGKVEESVEVSDGQVSSSQSTINPAKFLLSVYNEGNILPRRMNGIGTPSWRNPHKFPIVMQNGLVVTDEYRENDGTLSKIYITIDPNDATKYFPRVKTGATIKLDAENKEYIYPSELNGVEDFIRLFRTSWAKQLVGFHPEYGYYQFCLDINASNDFDEELLESSYVAFKVNHSSWSVLSNSNYNFFHDDPLFKETTASIPGNPYGTAVVSDLRAAMLSKLTTYFYDGTSTLNAMQIARIAKYCKNPRCKLPAADCSPLVTEAVDDSTWNHFKLIYLSVKQGIKERLMHDLVMNPSVNTYSNHLFASYNGCIGEGVKFNRSTLNYISKVPDNQVKVALQNLSSTQPWTSYFVNLLNANPREIFNPEQPCNSTTFRYYVGKTKRFGRPEYLLGIDALLQEVCEEADDYEEASCESSNDAIVDELLLDNQRKRYLFCNQTPLAYDMEVFLNSFIKQGLDFNTTVNGVVCQVPGLSEGLIDALYNPADLQSTTLQALNWQLVSTSPTVNVALAQCTLSFPANLNTATGGIFDTYNQIASVCCLNALSATTFSIDIIKTDGTAASINVGSCIDLTDYTVEDNCKLTEEANELLSFLNASLEIESFQAIGLNDFFTEYTATPSSMGVSQQYPYNMILHSEGGLSNSSSNFYKKMAGGFIGLIDSALFKSNMGNSTATFSTYKRGIGYHVDRTSSTQFDLVFQSIADVPGSAATVCLSNTGTTPAWCQNALTITLTSGDPSNHHLENLSRFKSVIYDKSSGNIKLIAVGLDNSAAPIEKTFTVDITFSTNVSGVDFIYPLLECRDLEEERLAYSTDDDIYYECELSDLGKDVEDYLLGLDFVQFIQTNYLSFIDPNVSDGTLAVHSKRAKIAVRNTVGNTPQRNINLELGSNPGTEGDCFLEFSLEPNPFHDATISSIVSIDKLYPNKTKIDEVGTPSMLAEVTLSDGSKSTMTISMNCGVLYNCYSLKSNQCEVSTKIEEIEYEIKRGNYTLPTNPALTELTFANLTMKITIEGLSQAEWNLRELLDIRVLDHSINTDGKLFSGVITLLREYAGRTYTNPTFIDKNDRIETYYFTANQSLGNCTSCNNRNLFFNGNFNVMEQFQAFPERSIGVKVPSKQSIIDEPLYYYISDYTSIEEVGKTYPLSMSYGNALSLQLGEGNLDITEFWSQRVSMDKDKSYKFSFDVTRSICNTIAWATDDGEVFLQIFKEDPSVLGRYINVLNANYIINNNSSTLPPQQPEYTSSIGNDGILLGDDWVRFKDDVINVSDNGNYWFVLSARANDSRSFSIGFDNITLKEDCIPEPSILCGPLETEFNIVNLVDSCEKELTQTVQFNARKRYEAYIEEQREDFREAYIAKCLRNKEDFSMNYTDVEHHFTLYYYDEAGNLVRTVPPKGVTKITDATELAQIKNDRKNHERNIFTDHKFATTYSYNSLNQLISQQVPDNEDINEYYSLPVNNGIPTSFQGSDISFVNNYEGVMVGEDGTEGQLYFTDDGGTSWNNSQSTTIYDFNDVQVVDASHRYAVGEYGLMLAEIGGQPWAQIILPTAEDLIKVFFYSATEGYVVTKSGVIWKTIDAGTNWGQPINNLSNQLGTNQLDRISIAYDGTKTRAMGISTDGKFYRASNVEQTWLEGMNIEMDNAWATTTTGAHSFVSSKAGRLFKVDGDVLNDIESDEVEGISDLHAKDENNLVALVRVENCCLAKVKTSSDGGKTWTPVGTTMNSPYDLYFSSATEGYTLSNTDKKVYKTTTTGASWTSFNYPTITGRNPFFLQLYHHGGTTVAYNNLEGSRANEFYSHNGTNWSYYDNAFPADVSHKVGTNGARKILKLYVFDWQSSTPSNREGYAILDNKSFYHFDGTTWVLWSSGTLNTGEEYVDIYFEDKDNGYGLTNQGRIMEITNASSSPVTTPKTMTTTPISVTNGEDFVSIDFEKGSNPQSGFITLIDTDDDIVVLKTTDGGVSWLNMNHRINPQTIRAVDYQNNGGQAFVAGDNGILLYTINDGLNWKYKNTRFDIDAHVMDFSDASFQSGVIAEKNGTFVDLTILAIPKVKQLSHAVGTETINAIHFEPDLVKFLRSNSTITTYIESNSTEFTDDVLPSTSTESLNAIVKDANDAYLTVGNVGTILSLSATATTWVKENNLTRKGINSVYHLNSQEVYAAADDKQLYSSADGGRTWTEFVPAVPASIPLGTDLLKAVFTSANQGLVVGTNGEVHEFKRNRSPEWKAISGTNSSYDYHSIDFLENNLGFFLGSGSSANNELWLTTTGINGTYSKLTTGLSMNRLNAIHIVDSRTAFMVGNSGTVQKASKSSAGGTWQISTLQSFCTSCSENGLDVYFKDRKSGYVVTDKGNLYKTGDGGSTWELREDLNGASNNNVSSITFNDNGKGFYTGQGGTVGQVNDLSNLFSTRYYYDKLGRLVASQNAKQFTESPTTYSYTLYDGLGRIKEAGRLDATASMEANYAQRQLDQTAFNDWIEHATRTEVLKTFYSEALSCGSIGIIQKELRNRVSATIYQATYSTNNCQYEHATHYSYDAHGNVKTLIQDFPDLAELDQRYKRIDYEYDLISGNVLCVSYQSGAADQFYHKYEYDADNRILRAFTSSDKVYWDEDVNYEYYRHGPLKRTNLGKLEVQGMDYAYTIQGWLKGVNSSTNTRNRDIGKDAWSGTGHQWTAADAYGYTLGYHTNDYKDIAQTSASNHFVANISGTSIEADAMNLYNGNINYMATAMYDPSFTSAVNGPLATVYQYDQLNRIKNADAYTASNVEGNNNWSGATKAAHRYQTTYSYDANGNILDLTRRAQDGALMDHLQYKYQNKDDFGIIGNDFDKKYTNRLLAVDDVNPNGTTTIAEDMEGIQSFHVSNPNLNNYQYDGLGNLTADKAEKIKTIEWTTQGKIKRIEREIGSDAYDYEFYYDANGNRIRKVLKKRSGGNPTYEEDWLSTYYVRDAQGNILSTYEKRFELPIGRVRTILEQKELNIYGSSRLGVFNRSQKVSEVTADLWGYEDFNFDRGNFDEPIVTSFSQIPDYLNLYRGTKCYELSNHLGNVLAVINDNKTPEYTATSSTSNVFTENFKEEDLWRPYDEVDIQYNDQSMVVTSFGDRQGIVRTFEPVAADACTYTYCFTIGEPVPQGGFYFETYDGGMNPIHTIYINEPGEYCVPIGTDVENIAFILENPNEGDIFIIMSARLDKTCVGSVFSHYEPIKKQLQDYYPFGMLLPGRRKDPAEGYRYGFNGYERDDEIKGSGNSIDFGARIYDPRIGKFLSIDPKFKSYPYWSPYLFAANNPIRYIDIYGEGPQDKIQAQYDRLTTTEKGVIFRPQATPQLTVIRAGYILATLDKNKKLAEASTIEQFGFNGRNDESDAYRHALFNALNTQSLGKDLAKQLSDAHEAIDDPVELANNKGEIEMDVNNNTVGQEIGENNPDASFESITSKVIGALTSGKLKAFDNPRDNTKDLNPTKGTKFMKPMPTLKLSMPLPEVKQDNTKTVLGDKL